MQRAQEIGKTLLSVDAFLTLSVEEEVVCD